MCGLGCGLVALDPDGGRMEYEGLDWLCETMGEQHTSSCNSGLRVGAIEYLDEGLDGGAGMAACEFADVGDLGSSSRWITGLSAGPGAAWSCAGGSVRCEWCGC
jgi:hypothetical protein